MRWRSCLVNRTGALDSELRNPQPLPALPDSVPTGIPSTLARRRPDVREASLHAATAQIGVSVAQLFPSLESERPVWPA